MILSHAWLPGVTNRWQWNDTAFQEIIHFGKWMFISSVLGFLVNSGDRLLLGSFVDTNVLGVYVIAYLIYSSIEQVLMKIISDVSLPTLSEVVRERLAELKPSYYRFHVVIGSFAYICFRRSHYFRCLAHPPFIRPPLRASGLDAGDILAVALLTVPLRVGQLCFLALELPRVYTYPITIRMITLYMLTPIGFYFSGLSGALAGIVAGYLSTVPVILFYNIKLHLFDFRKELLMLMALPTAMLIAEGFNLAVGYWKN